MVCDSARGKIAIEITVRRQCDITREANALARKARICAHCGKGFTQGSRSATQTAKGELQRYCSNACTADSKRLYASEAEAKRAYHIRKRERDGKPAVGSTKLCAVCAEPFAIANVNSRCCSIKCAKVETRRNAIARYVPTSFHCAECGAAHVTSYGNKATVYCSTQCSRAAARKNAIASGQRAAQRKARKLKQRGASVEHVNPLKVLERDRWTCQLCGIKTPKGLRGTFDDRAPEVDHIVSLADGGEHSYRNTQCACRKCNLAKSGNSKGQLRLFG
jgi:5-methylcytosine-specific restriction endonuclease McrA